MGSSIGFQTPTRQEWHLTSTHSLRLPSKRSLDKKKSSRAQNEVCRGSADDDHEDGEDLQLETVDLDEEVRRARRFDCNRCGYSVKNRALFCESKDCQECIMAHIKDSTKPIGECKWTMQCKECCTRYGQEELELDPNGKFCN